MKYILLLSMVSVVFSGSATVLTDDVDSYCCGLAVTDWGAIIHVNGEGELCILNPDYSGGPIRMFLDWGTALDGWGSLSRVGSLAGSPDGRFLCFTQVVAVPDEYYSDDAQYIPYPEIVAVCRSDGTSLRVMGLSFDVGSGPHFAFTGDSRFVYGGPWLECLPTPADFIEYFSGDGTGRLEPWLMMDVDTGERSGDPSVIGDGFIENPYSDLVAAGWYPPNTIVDIRTQEVLLEDTSSSSPAIVEQWVLPDAGLARTDDGRQVLRYADGRETVNPGPRVDVYCGLADGRYIFTEDGGESVMLGGIDWSDFSSTWSVPLHSLDGLYPGSIMKEIPDGTGVVFVDGGSLKLAQLP
ncbi:MAG: hypothetical protein JXA64_01280 [Candidatus Fermentibacteraceae bacterium]|nr:hypothetical protein [Candidatus Fermentibacteraceae bacterium]MBN2607718.1 hypothetical protein [Candidatus Fermentibacteraceae bacterium]